MVFQERPLPAEEVVMHGAAWIGITSGSQTTPSLNRVQSQMLGCE